MFEVPHSPPSANPRRLALLWMGVAVVNAVFWYEYLIFRLLRDMIDLPYSTLMSMEGQIELIQALFVMTVQWLILQRFFPKMRYWAALHASFLLLQNLLYWDVSRLIGRLLEALNWSGDIDIAIYQAQTFLWALTLGIVGWIIFRAVVSRARLWLWAVLLGSFVSLFINRISLPLNIPSERPTYQLVFYVSVLLPAAIQAAVLVVFLRERERPAALAPV